jgi:DNA-binding NarL/FixJ family response regulator
MIKKPRLLVVEDEEVVRRNLCTRFTSPPPQFADEYQVPGFEVTPAATGVEAEKLLGEAEKRKQPYDVLVLDLGLPRANPKDREEEEVGLGLLRSAVRETSCAAVVIQSHHDDRPTIIRTLQHGVADFIPKPYQPEQLLRAVFRAYRKGQYRSSEAWGRFKNEHLLKQITTWMYREGQGSVADRMGRAASEGVAEVLRRLGGVERHLNKGEPWDGAEEIHRGVSEVRDAALSILDRCAEARQLPGGSSPVLQPVVLTELLEGVLDRLSLGIAYKRLTLEFDPGPRMVLSTFEEDVKSIIDAIVFQAIDAAPLCTGLKVGVDRLGPGQVAVRVTAREVCRPVCYPYNAEAYLPGQEVVGCWGLALARRLAHDVYGHIAEEVTAQGQTVSLYLPTVDDAPTTDG